MERALVVWGVKGAIVLGAGLLLAQAMSRASAAARHLVLCASFAAALALPVLGAVLPALQIDAPGWMTALASARKPSTPATRMATNSSGAASTATAQDGSSLRRRSSATSRSASATPGRTARPSVGPSAAAESSLPDAAPPFAAPRIDWV